MNNFHCRIHSKRESIELSRSQYSNAAVSPKRLLSILKKANDYLEYRNPNVVCLPVAMCPVLYGSKQEHFTLYGYVTPTQAGCLSKNGLALCVSEEDNNIHKPPKPSVVCVPVGECKTLYGSDPEHFIVYGYVTPTQTGCLSKNGQALCISSEDTPTSSVVCVPVGSCQTLYGSNPEHFAIYGYVTPTQANCPSKSGWALCISEENNPSQNPTSSSVNCVPVGACQTVYGSDPAHFATYGYITPTQANCPSGSGLVLCVSSESKPEHPINTTPVTTIATTTEDSPIIYTPTNPTIELPCVPITECRVIFGTMYQHSMYYGPQKECGKPHLRRCVAVEPYVPTTPSTSVTQPSVGNSHPHHSSNQHYSGTNTVHVHTHKPFIYSTTTPRIENNHSGFSSPANILRPSTHEHQPQTTSAGIMAKPSTSSNSYHTFPCILPMECDKIYGTSYEHFVYFGLQNECEDKNLMRCIQPNDSIETNDDVLSMYTSPLLATTKQPPTLLTEPEASNAESQLSPYHSVQIIGPKPIYLTLSNIEGPKVLNDHGTRISAKRTDDKYVQTQDGNRRNLEYVDMKNNKNTQIKENPKRFYLQGINLDALFNLNNERKYRRNAQEKNRNNFKSPSYPMLRGLRSYDDSLFPSTLEKFNRQFGTNFSHERDGKSHTFQKDPEKNYLNVDSFEHLFFENGGKIKVPYDTNENSNNYLFFSPKRKLLRTD